MTCSRRRASRDIHIYKDAASCRWVVASGRRARSWHRTQRTAVIAGTRAARHRRVDLVIHARSGRIRSKDSYGNESPRRDREH